jgi:hypothetical protein
MESFSTPTRAITLSNISHATISRFTFEALTQIVAEPTCARTEADLPLALDRILSSSSPGVLPSASGNWTMFRSFGRKLATVAIERGTDCGSNGQHHPTRVLVCEPPREITHVRADIDHAGARHDVFRHHVGVGRLVVGEDRLEQVFLSPSGSAPAGTGRRAKSPWCPLANIPIG